MTELVTRGRYDAVVAERDRVKQAHEETAERYHTMLLVHDTERDRLKTEYDRLLTSWAECKEQRDRLAAALATAQARIEESRAHLGAAVVQIAPSDDQIIAGHIRAAHDALAGKVLP